MVRSTTCKGLSSDSDRRDELYDDPVLDLSGESVGEEIDSSSPFFVRKKAAAVLKHGILNRYVVPFASKVGQDAPDGRVVHLDGYAGPGRYEDGTMGSPALILEAAARVADFRRLECYFVERGRKTSHVVGGSSWLRGVSPAGCNWRLLCGKEPARGSGESRNSRSAFTALYTSGVDCHRSKRGGVLAHAVTDKGPEPCWGPGPSARLDTRQLRSLKSISPEAPRRRSGAVARSRRTSVKPSRGVWRRWRLSSCWAAPSVACGSGCRRTPPRTPSRTASRRSWRAGRRWPDVLPAVGDRQHACALARDGRPGHDRASPAQPGRHLVGGRHSRGHEEDPVSAGRLVRAALLLADHHHAGLVVVPNAPAMHRAYARRGFSPGPLHAGVLIRHPYAPA